MEYRFPHWFCTDVRTNDLHSTTHLPRPFLLSSVPRLRSPVADREGLGGTGSRLELHQVLQV